MFCSLACVGSSNAPQYHSTTPQVSEIPPNEPPTPTEFFVLIVLVKANQIENRNLSVQRDKGSILGRANGMTLIDERRSVH